MPNCSDDIRADKFSALRHLRFLRIFHIQMEIAATEEMATSGKIITRIWVPGLFLPAILLEKKVIISWVTCMSSCMIAVLAISQ